MQLLLGLEHLHRNGLQHRDVKPGNLLFVRGKLKLGDLGLTSRDDARQSCGTVGYVPPGSKEPDDLYAAGIVLYEMLTGLSASQFPDWPEDLDPSQDARLAGIRAIFSRACDRDPQRRFADAPSFRTALEKANTASATINQVRAGDRRARRLAFLACGLCVAIAIAAAWFSYELYGAKYGFSYGEPPFNGSVAKLYSKDRKYLFEWSTSEKRLAVPTNSDERHVELFDLEARLDGSQLLIRGQTRCWSLGNPLPRRIEEANPGKHGEIVEVFLVLKTEAVERSAKEVSDLSRDSEWQRGKAAREKQFDTRFPKEIQLLVSAQLSTSPGSINGFMHGVDLAALGLTRDTSYPILAFVTAAETYEMHQSLATCITQDAGLRLGSVQYTPNPD